MIEINKLYVLRSLSGVAIPIPVRNASAGWMVGDTVGKLFIGRCLPILCSKPMNLPQKHIKTAISDHIIVNDGGIIGHQYFLIWGFTKVIQGVPEVLKGPMLTVNGHFGGPTVADKKSYPLGHLNMKYYPQSNYKN